MSTERDDDFAYSSKAAAHSVWVTTLDSGVIVNGDKVADFQISVSGVFNLGADDFLL